MNRPIDNPKFVLAEELCRVIFSFFEHHTNNGETEGFVEEQGKL